jgi:hypothetical protein
MRARAPACPQQQIASSILLQLLMRSLLYTTLLSTATRLITVRTLILADASCSTMSPFVA